MCRQIKMRGGKFEKKILPKFFKKKKTKKKKKGKFNRANDIRIETELLSIFTG